MLLNQEHNRAETRGTRHEARGTKRSRFHVTTSPGQARAAKALTLQDNPINAGGAGTQGDRDSTVGGAAVVDAEMEAAKNMDLQVAKKVQCGSAMAGCEHARLLLVDVQ